MSDVALAAGRIREVAGDRGTDEPIKALLDRAYDALSRSFPKSRWTRRRVRALWNKEAGRVDYREIAEMDAIIAEARKRHAAYVEDSARIRAFAASLLASLEHTDPDFHRTEIERLRGELLRVDRAGTEGRGR